MSLSNEHKSAIISEYQLSGSDTGSPEVQVALLTAGYERVLGEVIGAKSPPAEWPAEISAAVASHRQGPPDDDTLLVAVVRGGEAASKENSNVAELDTPESSSRRAQAG